MSNRTLLEFNHDVNWTSAPKTLIGVLDEVRRSIPSGSDKRSEDVRSQLVRLGITYLTTRHHSDPPLDRRMAELEAEVAKLKADKAKLVKAGKAAASALDALMGDSDLDDDHSPEFKACQRMNRVLDAVSK
jgi:hypothetical protein